MTRLHHGKNGFLELGLYLLDAKIIRPSSPSAIASSERMTGCKISRIAQTPEITVLIDEPMRPLADSQAAKRARRFRRRFSVGSPMRLSAGGTLAPLKRVVDTQCNKFPKFLTYVLRVPLARAAAVRDLRATSKNRSIPETPDSLADCARGAPRRHIWMKNVGTRMGPLPV